MANGPALHVGRAITFDDFVRGLTSGWFGAAGMDAADARAFAADLKATLAASAGADGAVAIIKASLDPGTPVPTLDRRVTWYFYDENLPTDPLIHVASNLAHRLALPGVKGKKIGATNPKDFIVFSIPITSIDDPRKPQFTDSGELRFLEVWRPGGKTAPWIAGCLGLDEAVGAPTILATSISDVRSTQCYEP